MLDSRVIKVLEYLLPFGFTSIVNIEPIINELFIYEALDSEFDFNIIQRNAKNFIVGLLDENLITVSKDHIYYRITSFNNRNNVNSWYAGGLEASITKNGLQELSEYKKAKLADAAHQSSMAVSDSIIRTNTSVQDTNKIVQDVSTTQRNLAYISLLIVALSTIYLILTYYKDDSPALKSIDRQLQRQERLLDSMRKSQKGIDSSLMIMAKKTSPKKRGG